MPLADVIALLAALLISPVLRYKMRTFYRQPQPSHASGKSRQHLLHIYSTHRRHHACLANFESAYAYAGLGRNAPGHSICLPAK